MYKENQEEVKNLQELHRPYLILDTEVRVNENTEEQIVNIDIDFLIENNGDRPAYNTRLRTCYAPSRTPQDIRGFPDALDTNPLHPGISPLTVPISFSMPFEITEGGGREVYSTTTLIYVHLQYQDALTGGRQFEDTYWFAYFLDKGALVSAIPEQKSAFEPFVVNYYANKDK